MSTKRNANSAQAARIALVCDWLVTPGGAEKVLLELHRMYPDAPIYTSQYRPRQITWFADADVRTGWLNFFPVCLRRYIGLFRQFYFSHLDLSAYDLVISVTGAEAKAVRTQRKHICFCHVPTQYYWQFYDQYLKNPGFGPLNPLARLGLKLLAGPLRQADYRAAQRPDQFVTISHYAADQIQKYYGRQAEVIFPPVDTQEFSTGCNTLYIQRMDNVHTKSVKNAQIPSKNVKNVFKRTGFVISCRQVTWKRVDLAIQACLQAGKPLTVIGDGPEHANLVRLAHHSSLIQFVPWVETAELAQYLQAAAAYIFPSLEPFGIAPVEALAAGCPVIAYAAGGSRDIVTPGENGLLFPEQTVDSLASALVEFERTKFSEKSVIASAQQFSTDKFRQGITKIVNAQTQNSSTPATSRGRQ